MRFVSLLVFVCLVLSAVNARAGAKNLAVNPSFEDGGKGWTWREHSAGWHPFVVDTRRAHTGRHAIRESLEKHPVSGGAQIWGALQRFEIRELPQKLGVWYRIENWQQAVEKQYVQVVVMIHDERLEKIMTQPQMQVRYILAGVSKPPYADPLNGRYIMAGGRKSKKGRWVRFETDPVKDFVEAWGWYPVNFKAMEIFLEARYDEPVPEGVSVSGDVYWDDVSVVPAPAGQSQRQ